MTDVDRMPISKRARDAWLTLEDSYGEPNVIDGRWRDCSPQEMVERVLQAADHHRGRMSAVDRTPICGRNAKCPACGSRQLDRVDCITREARRRIEAIEDSQSIYGLRPISSQPDRLGASGRHGLAIECADCGWRVDGRAGDAQQNPEFQDLLRSLLDGPAERRP